MSRKPDPQRVADLIIEVAAREIPARYATVDRWSATEKTHPADIVTEADLAVEAALTPALAAIAPHAVVVGEEACAANPDLVRALEGEGAAWLIDPIDGTLNFASGVALFAVMVAYVENGRTVMGWIYDPIAKKMALAERGAGAFVGGRRMTTREPDNLGQVAAVINLRTMPPDWAGRIAGRLRQIGSHILLRSAGQEYLVMAEGRIDAALYNRTMPWDHAPGALLLEEAGGVVRRLDGRDYRPGDPAHTSPILAASGEGLWRELADKVIGD